MIHKKTIALLYGGRANNNTHSRTRSKKSPKEDTSNTEYSIFTVFQAKAPLNYVDISSDVQLILEIYYSCFTLKYQYIDNYWPWMKQDIDLDIRGFEENLYDQISHIILTIINEFDGKMKINLNMQIPTNNRSPQNKN